MVPEFDIPDDQDVEFSLSQRRKTDTWEKTPEQITTLISTEKAHQPPPPPDAGRTRTRTSCACRVSQTNTNANLSQLPDLPGCSFSQGEAVTWTRTPDKTIASVATEDENTPLPSNTHRSIAAPPRTSRLFPAARTGTDAALQHRVNTGRSKVSCFVLEPIHARGQDHD